MANERDQRRYECIQVKLAELEEVRSETVTDLKFASCKGYAQHGAIPRQFEPFDGLWRCAADTHAWLQFSPPALAAEEGRTLYLEIDTGSSGWDACNPQMLLFYDGKAVRGLDVNHRAVPFPAGVREVTAYMYSGVDERKYLPVSVRFFVRDERVHALRIRFSVLCDILGYTEDEMALRAELSNTLADACNALDFAKPYSSAFYASVDKAQKILSSLTDGHRFPAVWAIGHTHIDYAWLWTKEQTREKALRSFGTALSLLDEYPQYRFMSSQPALYECVREQDPDMFERIREKVRQGTWESEGAMWVEADCNLTSGESLVRQVLKGKQYFQKQFGKESRICWLPDVFGYSAALPQILKKSGVDVFVTSKISWNETNRMPHEIFDWQGIDGTQILSYFLTTQRKVKGERSYNFVTYNGEGTAAEAEGTYFRLSDKELTKDVLMPCGHGDGGGGTTPEMIERIGYLSEGVKGCARTFFAQSGAFFAQLRKNLRGKRVPRWVGELYLEFHRGTYTSVAKIKRANRKTEFALWRSELESVLASALCGRKYPAKELERCLLAALTNQFHDILPGSSVGAVYDAADKEYQQIEASLDSIESAALAAIAENVAQEGTLVFNPGCYEGEATVRVNGVTAGVKNIPAKGYAVINEFRFNNTIRASARGMESALYRIRFDRDGSIISLYDKRCGREVVRKGGACNRLIAYENLPYEFDNWELKDYYAEKPLEKIRVVSVQTVNDGVRRGVCFRRAFRDSAIVQTVWLYENMPRIDFETEIDWNEHHVVLRSESDLAIHADRAVYDIQFGAVSRPTHKNTSWDAAKFETCAHKFVDLSEYGYGVSLLNDCKYGHSAGDGKLGLTLLTCGTYPYGQADQGKHVFVYSLLPHEGDYREADVIGQAYLLNDPFLALPAAGHGRLDARFSLIRTNCKSVMIETVKRAEDGDGIIVRAFESFGGRTSCEFTLGIPVFSAEETDLLERTITAAEIVNNGFGAEFGPYEIKTFRFRSERENI